MKSLERFNPPANASQRERESARAAAAVAAFALLGLFAVTIAGTDTKSSKLHSCRDHPAATLSSCGAPAIATGSAAPSR
jgi:hypothetical protein